MRDANQRLPIKRLIAIVVFIIAVSALWAYSNQASIYSLKPTPGHHVVYYVESSSGCILWLFLWDLRGMDALPFEGELHGPLTPTYRWAFFGHEDGERLKPFRVFAGIQSSSSAFGFTLPYWLFIILAAGYGALTLRRWRLADPKEKAKIPEVNSVA